MQNLKSFITIIALLLISLSFFSAKDVDEAHRIMKVFNKYAKKKYDLVLLGSGGAMMDDIEIIALSYSGHQILDVDATRILYIELLEKLLEMVNSDKKIRPYLHDYPFSEKNIQLDISFFDQNNKSYSDGHIAYVFFINGTIYYDISDPKKTIGNPLTTVHQESYEEALRIVKSNKNQ